MAGRTSKRTPDRRKRLLKALTAGNTRRAACALAGISEDTLGRWLRDEADFAADVKNAEDKAEAAFAATIKRAASERKIVTRKTIMRGDSTLEVTETETVEFNWQAAAWWLERRRSEDYAQRQTVIIQVQRAIADLLDFIEGQNPVLYEQLSELMASRTQSPQQHTA